MPNPQHIIDRVSSDLKSSLSADLVAQKQITSITLPIKDINLRSLPTTEGSWLFWNHPAAEETILGLGSAVQITATGPNRLTTLNHRLEQLRSNWQWLDQEQTGCNPQIFVCFTFNPTDQMTGPWSGLPNSGLFLPELTILQRDNYCTAIFSADFMKGSEIELIHQRWIKLFTLFINSMNRQDSPPGCKTSLTRVSTSANQEEWSELISKAQNSISSGIMEKVVPARHLRVCAERNLNPKQLMTALSYLYPSSMLLGSSIQGRTFISATPERLVSYQDGIVNCDALAGTTHRSAVEKLDQDLGQQLLADNKARHEHQLVVEDISASLKKVCSEIEHLKQPSLLRLRNLQHLHTEITGRLKSDISLLQAAERLHPTAAVNGYPGPNAAQWLTQNEPFERGWYTGTAGWINWDGNGTLAVLLRCAILDDNYADLYAGAGITLESAADAEYAETELKFSVMLEALENA